MSGEVIVSSTTDSQEAVNAAAKAYSTPQPEEEKVDQPSSEPSERPEDETEAESEPAEKPESEEPEEEEEPEATGKSRKRLIRQVSRLTGRNYKLQEQLEELQARLEQIQTGPKQPQPAPAERPRPTQDNYKTYEEFVEALADWKIEQRDQAKVQAAQNAYVQQVYDEYNHQVEVARDSHDDWDEVVGQSVSVPQIAINLMYELDNGAEVAYFLGKHPEVRDQLLEWNEPGTKGGLRKIVVELDRISAQLGGKSSSNESSPRPRSAPPSPPAPIRPVGATARSTADPGEMNMRDYKKWIAKNYPHMR